MMPIATLAEQNEYIERHCDEDVAFVQRLYHLDRDVVVKILRLGFTLGWNAYYVQENQDANNSLPTG